MRSKYQFGTCLRMTCTAIQFIKTIESVAEERRQLIRQQLSVILRFVTGMLVLIAVYLSRTVYLRVYCLRLLTQILCAFELQTTATLALIASWFHSLFLSLLPRCPPTSFSSFTSFIYFPPSHFN